MNYFNGDGIRGKISLDFSNKLGSALDNISKKDIFIGYDGREGSLEIAKSIFSGIKNNKCYISNNITITSNIMYLSYINKSIGVMVTASHNPYYDNGIKIFIDGYKINIKTQEELSIYINKINEPYFNYNYIYKDIISIYIEYLKKYIKKTNLKIVIDAGNGGASYIVKDIFNLVSDNIIYISCEPNGININETGAVNTYKLINVVKENNFDLGIAFDGDADRIIIVDKDRIYDGDDLIYLILKNNKSKEVVLTRISNKGLLNKLYNDNINYFITDVGDTNVLKYMIDNNIMLGSEPCGHIINREILDTGCGILNSLYILNIINNREISKLIDYKKMPVKSGSIKVNNINKVEEKIKNIIYMIKEDIKDIDIIIRKSNTENKLRVNITHNDKIICDQIYKIILDEILILDGLV